MFVVRNLIINKCGFFFQTEAMLQTAEDLAGPYVWGQYDLLVLPPSFPYGGMENPCLTFVTPTLLVSVTLVKVNLSFEFTHPSYDGGLSEGCINLLSGKICVVCFEFYLK